ncbi:leucine-rich repeat protein, putative [Bodo saltans]|uniref:Leucine-rich repeat protein, putative n=1 Tax=Bodo saltans TaxID=75058 RepID=A0A0S4JE69_BODSA|nr:leucine-rich repeat protein, putative [Bodo saltans]|eukprot:CUG88273.1 leucine-rich repeat protein, putative [Bodo saltans]
MNKDFGLGQGLLSPVGQPYSAAEIHAKFPSTTPQELYGLLCKSCKCKVIPGVAMMFPDTQRSWGTMTSLDLSHSYVGPKGVVPVVEMCKALPNITSIALRDNYLSNESVWLLSKMALYHPSLTTLDLGKNPISWTGAMCLVELVTRNHHITDVLLVGTSIPPNVTEAISAQALKNASLGASRARNGINPCNHPTTIRQRAMRRYFHDVATRNGKQQDVGLTVPKSLLADGLKELWKISGREREITQRTPLFYENFVNRASQDSVTWEEFFLVIMLEDVKYNEGFVDRLKAIFEQFDVEGCGYVEARALRGMMTQLSPTQTPPTAEELQMKMRYYDLDSNMTLGWDEFLLLMYDHGPVVGSKGEMTQTPIPLVAHAHHN